MSDWQALMDGAAAEMVRRDIGSGQSILVRRATGTETVRILGFHGGGGVDGRPEMLAPLFRIMGRAGHVTSVSAGYRTLNRDGAALDDMLRDACHALDWCRKDMPPGSRLYLLGASFGGLLALHAALESPDGLAGLLLLNPVTDIAQGGFSNRVVPAEGFPHLSPMQRYAGHPVTRRLTCFIAHGEKDDVVPIRASRDFALHWPAERLRFEAFPNSVHGFFNRAPHDETTAGMLLDFTARTVEESVPAARIPEGTTLLYGIGAQKAGTSWLFDFLDTHPDCHCTATKELHYFDMLHSMQERGHYGGRIDLMTSLCGRVSRTPRPGNQRFLDRIERVIEQLRMYSGVPGDHANYVSFLTRGHSGQKILVDITPSYGTLDRVAFADMDSLGPAKFVFILRDPVDRLWSQINMLVQDGGKDPTAPDYLGACIDTARQMHASGRLAALPRADYARTMTELESVIPRDRICYLFYEDMFRQASVDRLCRFLAIAETPADTDKRVGSGGGAGIPEDVRNMLHEGLRAQYDAVFDRFGATVPEHWRRFG